MRVFLLSPALLSGVRGRRLLDGGASPIAERLREAGCAPLGDVYASISSLYFRGKLTYARRFAARWNTGPAAFVITPNRGILPVDTNVTLEELRALASTPIDEDDATYRGALTATVTALCRGLDDDHGVVLLGSLATRKYLDPLIECLGDRLLVPSAFFGRGDMSRGSLLLRAVAEGRELEYVPVR